MSKYPEMASHLAMGFAAARDAQPAVRVEYTILLHLCAHFQAAQHAFDEHDALILDEGFFHHQAALAALSDDSSDQARLVESLRVGPIPNVLIWVDAPVELAERRKPTPITRARTLRAMSQSERLKFLDRWAKCIGVMLAEVQDRVNIVPIRNDEVSQDVDKRLSTIVSCLEQSTVDNGVLKDPEVMSAPSMSVK